MKGPVLPSVEIAEHRSQQQGQTDNCDRQCGLAWYTRGFAKLGICQRETINDSAYSAKPNHKINVTCMNIK